MAGTVVLAYDGSADAQRAVETARELLAAEKAVVVHVRVLPMPPIIGADPGGEQSDSPDAAQERQADRIVSEGVDAATKAGFDAEGVVKTADSMTGVWRALLDVAEEHGAAAVVAGHRGISRFRSALLGSVSNGLVNHAHIPVLVVPPAER
jgi:nucleotide-binding universal stress UspA family protein